MADFKPSRSHIRPTVIRIRSLKEAQDYKSLTSPWRKSWLAECITRFLSKSSIGQEETTEKIRPKEKTSLENVKKERKSRVLGRFKSIFPLQLFPDELIVEEERVVWIDRIFPWSSKAISIMATDISSVEASHGPFFGHLHVGSLVGGPAILIESLSRASCVKARALIEGIILTEREGGKLHKKRIEREKAELTEAGEVRF